VLLWRETASGIGLGAHFLASNIIDCLWIVVAPALFLGPYYYLTLPVSPSSPKAGCKNSMQP
jgi:hypothetical protein